VLQAEERQLRCCMAICDESLTTSTAKPHLAACLRTLTEWIPALVAIPIRRAVGVALAGHVWEGQHTINARCKHCDVWQGPPEHGVSKCMRRSCASTAYCDAFRAMFHWYCCAWGAWAYASKSTGYSCQGDAEPHLPMPLPPYPPSSPSSSSSS
jgi:hypothetical protein